MSKQFHQPCRAGITCTIFCFLFTLLASPVPAWAIASSATLQINRIAGSATGASGIAGDLGPCFGSLLAQPESVTIDRAGNVYIADSANNRIRRIAGVTGIISTFAGNGQEGFSGDGDLATRAVLNHPSAVRTDAHGNLYIADTGNHIVRFVDIETKIITTFAGTPNLTVFDPARIGDGGSPINAQFNSPAALALDTAGNLYIADSGDNRIREITAIAPTILTVAGTGIAGYTGNGGSAASAALNHPTGIALDAANNLYIADSGNNVIRKVNSGSGEISTLAGTSIAGSNGDGVGVQTDLNLPGGIAADMAGQIYFSDRNNNRVRKLNAVGNVETLVDTGVPQPAGIVLDPNENLYLADSGSNQVQVLSREINFPAVHQRK